MKRIATLLAGATLAFAPAAMAQTAPQTAPAPAPAPAAPATNATVTDAEVSQFVTVALEIENIKKDATIAEADKPAKMGAAASTAGIDPARFNAIGQAMATDKP